MAERRAEQNSLAACPGLTVCPWQVLSTGPSARQVYHLPHKAHNSCDSVRADLQSGSMAAVLALGNATLFSNECLAAQSVFQKIKPKEIPFPQEIQTQRSKSKQTLWAQGKAGAFPCAGGFVMAVFLQEKAQIRREERAKRQQRMEDVNTLKSMGYSERAAQIALRHTQGNLDQAFKVSDFQA